eukprot:14260635-Alexandrium_andersonii.AAC.1
MVSGIRSWNCADLGMASKLGCEALMRCVPHHCLVRMPPPWLPALFAVGRAGARPFSRKVISITSTGTRVLGTRPFRRLLFCRAHARCMHTHA